jgi:muramoyltetrapeptide carboxypeptidase
LTTLGKDAESADCFFRFLSGKLPSYSFRNNSTAKNKSGEAEGIVKGGNLSLLYSLMGSPEFPDLKDCILFLEDLDEYLYHIHRMMTALKRTGCFENLSGVVIGGMTEMKDNTIPFGKPAEEIIAESLSAFSFPIAYGFPGGHGEKNFALPLGGRAFPLRITYRIWCIPEAHQTFSHQGLSFQFLWLPSFRFRCHRWFS